MWCQQTSRGVGAETNKWFDKVRCTNLVNKLWYFDILVLLHKEKLHILGRDQLDALFLNVFILCLYMFRAASAHHQEVQIVLIYHLV
jgi:hypothetical protein